MGSCLFRGTYGWSRDKGRGRALDEFVEYLVKWEEAATLLLRGYETELDLYSASGGGVGARREQWDRENLDHDEVRSGYARYNEIITVLAASSKEKAPSGVGVVNHSSRGSAASPR